MSKRNVIFAAGILIVIIAGGLMAWNRYRTSPEYALRQVASAVEDHNRLRFQTYVDLDRLLPAVVDQLLGQAMLESFSDEDADGFTAIGTALGSGLGEQLTPALTQAFRTAVLRAVERGTLDSLYVNADTTTELNLREIGSGTGILTRNFRGLQGVQEEGDVALAGLGFHHEHLDTTLVLQLRMERVNDRWMIVGTENLGGYLDDVERLRRARIEAEIAEVRERIARMIEFGPFERERSEMGGITFATIERTVTNQADRPVHLAFASIEPPEGSDVDGEHLSIDTKDLAPGESTTITASLYGTSSSPVPSLFLDDPVDVLRTEIGIVVGEEDDAVYLAPFDRWDAYLERMQDPAGVAERILAASTEAGAADTLTDLLPAPDDPWIVSEETNPLDDSPIVVLATRAEAGTNSYGSEPSLVLRCRDNTTEVYISWDDYLGGEYGKTVTHRIGDGGQGSQRWSLSTTKTATFFPGSHIGLIRRLMEVDRFVAQVTPYNSSPVTAVFNVRGLEESVEPLREACHW